MYFIGHLKILIAGKLLETVTDVEITNDAAQLGANCDITVPLTIRIKNEDQYLIDNVRNLFKSGDFVQVWAWYDGYDQQYVFEGFLYDFLEGTPLKIRCLDYVYKLRQGTKNLAFPKAKISKVIGKILEGTGITLKKPFVEFDIVNMTFPNMSPAACLEWLKKELGLTVTIIGKELYFNIASNTLDNVKLDSSINVIKCEMQKPEAAFQKFKIKAYIKKANGTKEAVEIGDEDGQLREISLMCVPSQTAKGTEKKNYHTQLADNALEQVRLGHYTGKITTLLYPFCDLFWMVDYTDKRYPERSAFYTVRANTLTLSKDGFHRELTTAFLKAK
jgi:hypothetical protein